MPLIITLYMMRFRMSFLSKLISSTRLFSSRHRYLRANKERKAQTRFMKECAPERYVTHTNKHPTNEYPSRNKCGAVVLSLEVSRGAAEVNAQLQ